jgi:AcrR family transcriptional regulator
MSEMPVEERQLRADAERNRRRLLEAAQALFRERGLDVSVAEIAQAADMGRGTLFRNFASKEDLIAAIVVERMREAIGRGQDLLEASDPEEALFDFIAEMVGRRQLDHALFEALDDTWLAREEIRAAHADIVRVLEGLLGRAQACGAVRPDVGAVDVLMLFKGACVACTAYAHVDPGIIDRQLDLIRASIAMHQGAPPLRGRAPTLGELEQSRPAPRS